MFLLLQHFIYDYKLLKGDVDPNQKVVDEEEDQDDTEDSSTMKHHRRLAKLISPAPLQNITSGLSHQVTHVHKQFTEMFKVWIERYFDCIPVDSQFTT